MFGILRFLAVRFARTCDQRQIIVKSMLSITRSVLTQASFLLHFIGIFDDEIPLLDIPVGKIL